MDQVGVGVHHIGWVGRGLSGNRSEADHEHDGSMKVVSECYGKRPLVGRTEPKTSERAVVEAWGGEEFGA